MPGGNQSDVTPANLQLSIEGTNKRLVEVRSYTM
jgi:hypothetical protein